ncbi:MAG TPA: DUF6444 domain-containing protein, partial [Pirellulaceae bacterium]|nr:DUF6444 domain-containing protein [Pirellulaceae bacterium]
MFPLELERAITPAVKAFVESMLDPLEAMEEKSRQADSRSSSRPTSTEHQHAKPKREPIPEGKPRGGQPGHLRQQRTLVPPEQCTAIVDCPPDGCRRCGGE